MSPRPVALLAASLLLLGWIPLAGAQGNGAPVPVDPTPAPATAAELFPVKAPSPRNWAVTISPVHFLLPVFEITGERRLSQNLGVALMIGAGSLTAKDESAGNVENTYKLAEIGASVRYYGLGTFAKGMQFGGALEFIRLTGDDIGGSMVSGIGSGLLLAPFVGYKHTMKLGITFDGQLGFSYAAIRAKTDNGLVQEDSKRVNAYLNLNVGWSF